MRTYIQYALELLNEKGFSNLEFAAMGRAINMAVLCAEILKRRVHGLHQITEVGEVQTGNGRALASKHRVCVHALSVCLHVPQHQHIRYKPFLVVELCMERKLLP